MSKSTQRKTKKLRAFTLLIKKREHLVNCKDKVGFSYLKQYRDKNFADAQLEELKCL